MIPWKQVLLSCLKSQRCCLAHAFTQLTHPSDSGQVDSLHFRRVRVALQSNPATCLCDGRLLSIPRRIFQLTDSWSHVAQLNLAIVHGIGS